MQHGTIGDPGEKQTVSMDVIGRVQGKNTSTCVLGLAGSARGVSLLIWQGNSGRVIMAEVI